MCVSSNQFGESGNSPVGSSSVFVQTNSANNNTFAPNAFGSTSSPFGAQIGSSSFGGTSTGVFGTPSSSPVFGASSSPAFGSSMPAFGAFSSPAFGASSSAFGGSSAFGSTTPSQSAFGVNLSGSTPFGASSQPAPGATSAPTLGATSAPAFGSTYTPAFGISPFGASSTPHSFLSSPAFGQSTPAFGSSPFGTATSPFGAQSFPFGAQTTTPVFGSPGFGQTSFGGQRRGSRVTPYAQTPEAFSGSGTQPAGKLESISAMYSYYEKSHEELRWEDYQLGDKGGPSPSNTFTPKTSTFTYTPGFGTTGSAFSNSPFGACSTPAFGQSTSAFSSATSPYGAQSSPFGGQVTKPFFGSCDFGQTSIGGQRVGPNPAGQTSGGMGFNTNNTTQSNPFSFSPAFTQLNSNPFSSTTPSNSLAPKTSTVGQYWRTPFGATGSSFGSGQSPAFVQSTSAYSTATSPFGARSSPFGGPNPAAHSHNFSRIGFSSSSPFGASSSNSIPFGLTPRFGSTNSVSPFGTPTSTSILGTNQAQGANPSFARGFNQTTPSLYLQPTQNSVEFGFWAPTGGTLRIIGQQGDKGANPSFATLSGTGFNHTTPSFSMTFQSAQPTQNSGGFGFRARTGGIGGTLSVSGGNNLVFSFSCLSIKEQ